MADICIDCPHGSIEITVDLATAKDGNSALTEAAASAKAQAQGRGLGFGYGTRRDGDTLSIVFPLKAE